MSSSSAESEVKRLPLWRSCLDEMIAKGISYKDIYSASFFEEQLKEKRDTMAFGLSISSIRRELEKLGFYLSGRGLKGDEFVILPPASNAGIMTGYQRRAADALKRGVILGTSTEQDMLSTAEQRRHEAILERIAIRASLVSRTVPIRELRRLALAVETSKDS